MNGKRQAEDLSEIESLILAIVLRLQPASTQKICTAFSRYSGTGKALRRSDGAHFIGKLRDHGLIKVAQNGQGGKIESLACTDAGEASARDWMFDFTKSLPQDPLSLRFSALPMLGIADRKAWVAGAKQAVLQDLTDTEKAAQESPDAHLDLLYDNTGLAAQG